MNPYRAPVRPPLPAHNPDEGPWPRWLPSRDPLHQGKVVCWGAGACTGRGARPEGDRYCCGADWGPKLATTRPVKRGLVAAVMNVCRARKAAGALTTAEGAAVAEGEEPTCSGE